MRKFIGDILFNEGDVSDSMYIVLEGSAHAMVSSNANPNLLNNNSNTFTKNFINRNNLNSNLITNTNNRRVGELIRSESIETTKMAFNKTTVKTPNSD